MGLLSRIFFGPQKDPNHEKSWRVDDVFNPGGFDVGPTYIARPDVERNIRDGLRKQNAVILFSGPTKSGKTVLSLRLDTDRPKACFAVYDKMTATEFWDALHSAIRSPYVVIQKSNVERRKTLKGDISVGGGAPGMDVRVGVGAEDITIERLFETEIHISRGRAGVLEFLRHNPRTIVIDDYHWMSEHLIPEVFPPLKQILGYGTRIILISVSNSTSFPTTGDFGDFAGRVLFLTMAPWTPSELRQIADRGFPLLNMEVSKRTVDYLVSCSYLSPLLMQGLCRQLCEENGISGTGKRSVKVDMPDRNSVGELAGRHAKGQTTSFDKILDDRAQKNWKSRDGRKLSLSEIVILGVSHTRPFQPFALTDLTRRLKDKILAEVPQNISGLIVQKVSEIQNKYGGKQGDRAPIYYDKINKTITIVDPYFKLWARWVRGPELGGKLFDD